MIENNRFNIEEIFKVNFKKQYPIGEHKVDFLFDCLIIEYGSPESIQQKINDKQRQSEIVNTLNKDRSFINDCYLDMEYTFVYVKEGEEYKGIREIMKYLVKREFIDISNGEYSEEENDTLWFDKESFISEIESNLIDLDYYKMTKEELIAKINSIF